MKQVVSVYSGINGKCCCGCCGKHTYASEHREYASKWRGYPVKDEEVSDRSVKIITKKVMGDPNMIDCGDYAYRVVGNRIDMVRFKK